MKEDDPLGTWLVIGASALLAIVHLTVRRLHFIEYVPRSRYLSFAGGISVAYVFLHLFPELDKHQAIVKSEFSTGFLSFISQHVYIAALLGLIIFYGMEKLVVKAKKTNKKNEVESSSRIDIFWPHVALFFFYNALIGYLLAHNETQDGWLSVLMFMIVMVPHLLVIDFSLRFHHEETYDKYGRWILAVAILIGTAVERFAMLPAEVFALLFAFLAGAITLNVLKEELPDERESSFGAFILGVAGYLILLQLFMQLQG
jgi:hypothetical protein